MGFTDDHQHRTVPGSVIRGGAPVARPPFILGIDTDVTTLRDADRLLHDLAAALGLPGDVFGSTHLVDQDGRRRVALCLASSSWAVLDAARVGLTEMGYAVTATAWNTAGRAVLFPGSAALTGALTLAELLDRSAIGRIRVLGATGAPDPEALLDTRDFVRPLWERGELVLSVIPTWDGTLVPLEEPADPGLRFCAA